MKIVGAGVCGVGEADKYLESTLKEFARLCDDVVICCNRTDDKTEQLIHSFNFWSYRDDREWGKYQPWIKKRLCDEYLRKLRPDWVLFLDMDEVFEKRVTKQTLQNLASSKFDICYAFWILDLWDDPLHFREDFLFETFRFWRFLPQCGMEFNNIPLHCGNAPAEIAHYTTFINFAILHYGLLTAKSRQEKFDRYKKYDPEGKYLLKDWYRALLTKNPPIVPIEQFYRLNLKEPQFRKKPPMPMLQEPKSNKKRWRFRRLKDNVIVTVDDERHYNDMLKRPLQFIYEGMEMVDQFDLPLDTSADSVPVQGDPLECPFCGFIANTEKGITLHKKRIHK